MLQLMDPLGVSHSEAFFLFFFPSGVFLMFLLQQISYLASPSVVGFACFFNVNVFLNVNINVSLINKSFKYICVAFLKQGKPVALSLRLNYWEINQTTSKCQIDFSTKLAKISKIEKVNMNITIKFCILKLVQLPNIVLNRLF